MFDEVQFFPKAREAIKHLVKDGRYDYVETDTSKRTTSGPWTARNARWRRLSAHLHGSVPRRDVESGGWPKERFCGSAPLNTATFPPQMPDFGLEGQNRKC